MSATVDVSKLRANQAVLVGKVIEARSGDKGWMTTVAQPAPDEFSSPSYCMVYSNRRIAAVGDVVSQLVVCEGYRYKVFPKDGGEPWMKTENVLRAVE